MKTLLWIVVGFGVLGLATWLITLPGPPHGPMLFLLVLVFAVAPVGAFWMMSQVMRYERRPFPLIAMAMFVPFTFLWYYLERVRPGKHKTRRGEPDGAF
jgi:thiol:disulfide interchange protein